ncbi:hypothetical protein H696_03990 [Fonticula alba]|uniref:Uncharacterized protein n=1 Tax=Fonticula alba TaxID=691883 RepID=A0A058Z6M7_FONAL|nr:hypothetical protein H696_03990 [Fonticula alba]KCV69568.1 hypothetical protein H696_03990 [Fonticula alba]|eukprot:XP_009496133.1 hypothetical protein H696_03990 [Fonticula alba]
MLLAVRLLLVILPRGGSPSPERLHTMGQGEAALLAAPAARPPAGPPSVDIHSAVYVEMAFYFWMRDQVFFVLAWSLCVLLAWHLSQPLLDVALFTDPHSPRVLRRALLALLAWDETTINLSGLYAWAVAPRMKMALASPPPNLADRLAPMPALPEASMPAVLEASLSPPGSRPPRRLARQHRTSRGRGRTPRRPRRQQPLQPRPVPTPPRGLHQRLATLRLAGVALSQQVRWIFRFLPASPLATRLSQVVRHVGSMLTSNPRGPPPPDLSAGLVPLASLSSAMLAGFESNLESATLSSADLSRLGLAIHAQGKQQRQQQQQQQQQQRPRHPPHQAPSLQTRLRARLLAGLRSAKITSHAAAAALARSLVAGPGPGSSPTASRARPRPNTLANPVASSQPTARWPAAPSTPDVHLAPAFASLAVPPLDMWSPLSSPLLANLRQLRSAVPKQLLPRFQVPGPMPAVPVGRSPTLRARAIASFQLDPGDMKRPSPPSTPARGPLPDSPSLARAPGNMPTPGSTPDLGPPLGRVLFSPVSSGLMPRPRGEGTPRIKRPAEESASPGTPGQAPRRGLLPATPQSMSLLDTADFATPTGLLVPFSPPVLPRIVSFSLPDAASATSGRDHLWLLPGEEWPACGTSVECSSTTGTRAVPSPGQSARTPSVSAPAGPPGLCSALSPAWVPAEPHKRLRLQAIPTSSLGRDPPPAPARATSTGIRPPGCAPGRAADRVLYTFLLRRNALAARKPPPAPFTRASLAMARSQPSLESRLLVGALAGGVLSTLLLSLLAPVALLLLRSEMGPPAPVGSSSSGLDFGAALLRPEPGLLGPVLSIDALRAVWSRALVLNLICAVVALPLLCFLAEGHLHKRRHFAGHLPPLGGPERGLGFTSSVSYYLTVARSSAQAAWRRERLHHLLDAFASQALLLGCALPMSIALDYFIPEGLFVPLVDLGHLSVGYAHNSVSARLDLAALYLQVVRSPLEATTRTAIETAIFWMDQLLAAPATVYLLGVALPASLVLLQLGFRAPGASLRPTLEATFCPAEAEVQGLAEVTPAAEPPMPGPASLWEDLEAASRSLSAALAAARLRQASLSRTTLSLEDMSLLAEQLPRERGPPVASPGSSVWAPRPDASRAARGPALAHPAAGPGPRNPGVLALPSLEAVARGLFTGVILLRLAWDIAFAVVPWQVSLDWLAAQVADPIAYAPVSLRPLATVAGLLWKLATVLFFARGLALGSVVALLRSVHWISGIPDSRRGDDSSYGRQMAAFFAWVILGYCALLATAALPLLLQSSALVSFSVSRAVFPASPAPASGTSTRWGSLLGPVLGDVMSKEAATSAWGGLAACNPDGQSSMAQVGRVLALANRLGLSSRLLSMTDSAFSLSYLGLVSPPTVYGLAVRGILYFILAPGVVGRLGAGWRRAQHRRPATLAAAALAGACLLVTATRLLSSLADSVGLTTPA